MNSCQNCGHDSHCGTNCRQNHTDCDSKEVSVLCCSHCRCENCIEEDSYTNESF